MKSFKYTFILLTTFNSLYSDQKSLKENNPFEISTSINTYTPGLSVSYYFKNGFSIGAAILKGNYPLDTYLGIPCTYSHSCIYYYNYNKFLYATSLSYYIFNTRYFITGYFGIIEGMTFRQTSLDAITFPNQPFSTNQIIEIEEKASPFFAGGLGYKWVFNNRLSITLEGAYGYRKSNGISSKIYDDKYLIEDGFPIIYNRPITISDAIGKIYFRKIQVESIYNKHYTNNNGIFEFFVGYRL